MTEHIALFGPEERVSAIVSTPAKATGGIAVILLNAGVIHRVGPGRLHVKIAHALAEQNIASMRIDLSGLGETPPAPAGTDHIAQASADIGAAIACMQEQTGSRTIYLAGICSGADHAYAIAETHEGVGGVILLDPYAYQSKAGHRRYLMKRALQPDRWRGFLGRILARSGNKEDGAGAAGPDAENGRILPPRRAFGQGLKNLVARGVRVHIFYTRSVQHMLGTPSDFHETFREFGLRDEINVKVDMTVDHTFTTLAAQDKVTQTIIDWLEMAK